MAGLEGLGGGGGGFLVGDGGGGLTTGGGGFLFGGGGGMATNSNLALVYAPRASPSSGVCSAHSTTYSSAVRRTALTKVVVVSRTRAGGVGAAAAVS